MFALYVYSQLYSNVREHHKQKQIRAESSEREKNIEADLIHKSHTLHNSRSHLRTNVTETIHNISIFPSCLFFAHTFYIYVCVCPCVALSVCSTNMYISNIIFGEPKEFYFLLITFLRLWVCVCDKYFVKIVFIN